jgi:hypothetical protein
VLAAAALADFEQVLRLVAALPPVEAHAGSPLHAPVLMLPRVLEPEFCRQLIELHQRHGGVDSGFMREIDGKTVAVLDHGFKRRSDHQVADETVRAALRERIQCRVVPAIEQAFQFRVTRMERYLVACYDATQGGHFRTPSPGGIHDLGPGVAGGRLRAAACWCGARVPGPPAGRRGAVSRVVGDGAWPRRGR